MNTDKSPTASFPDFKDGEQFSQSVIRTALIDAGDLAPRPKQGIGSIATKGKSRRLAKEKPTFGG
jgi:hypothetical protein